MLRQYFSLRKNLYKPRKYLENLQREKLIKLISIAYKETKYYKNFDKISTGRFIKGFNSFYNIPIMSKNSYRQLI